jgi:hypothetical protein
MVCKFETVQVQQKMKRRFFLVMTIIVGICTATFGFEGNDDFVIFF